MPYNSNYCQRQESWCKLPQYTLLVLVGFGLGFSTQSQVRKQHFHCFIQKYIFLLIPMHFGTGKWKWCWPNGRGARSMFQIVDVQSHSSASSMLHFCPAEQISGSRGSPRPANYWKFIPPSVPAFKNIQTNIIYTPSRVRGPLGTHWNRPEASKTDIGSISEKRID